MHRAVFPCFSVPLSLSRLPSQSRVPSRERVGVEPAADRAIHRRAPRHSVGRHHGGHADGLHASAQRPRLRQRVCRTLRAGLLDYTSGDATSSADQPGQFDCNDLAEPQDVVEYWAVLWNQHPNSHEPPHEAGMGLDLGVEWYRDLLRAKLVSLRIPKRLLLAYKAKSQQRDAALEEAVRQYEATRQERRGSPGAEGRKDHAG